jgi:CelD/BcsL family acetyltransferase involved in cellulose biosynthesis
MPANLVATILTIRDELDATAEEWNELLNASQANTIFLTWEWMTTWLDTVYPDAHICIIMVRDSKGQLVAVAPFYFSELRLLGTIKYKCLRVIGDCQSGAEYGDVIVRTGFEKSAMSVVSQALMDNKKQWDCIFFTNVPGWTDASQRITNMCSQQKFIIHERTIKFSMSSIPETHDAFLKSLSRNRRKQIKEKTHQLEKRHDVEFVSCAPPEELPELLSHLFELHRKRWESVGQKGSFVRRPPMQRFYEQFAPVALREGWLRLYALRLDGVVKAIQYGYAYNQAFHQLQEGFDPKILKGLGNVLRNQVFQACIKEGLQEYDNLGGFTEHKRRWGAVPREGFDFFICHRTLKNQLLFNKQIWPSGRYMQEGRPANEGRSQD